jgi:peptide chain release factor 2
MVIDTPIYIASPENQEIEPLISEDMDRLMEELDCKFLEILLSDSLDQSSCYLEIRCGAGGQESMDWVGMLSRMYTNWAKSNNFEADLIDFVRTGSAVGFHKVILKIGGLNAYGWCKGESGVHRLVRLSPFDKQGRRHTSFASVCVFPIGEGEIEDKDIPMNELKIETFRASGN